MQSHTHAPSFTPPSKPRTPHPPPRHPPSTAPTLMTLPPWSFPASTLTTEVHRSCDLCFHQNTKLGDILKRRDALELNVELDGSCAQLNGRFGRLLDKKEIQRLREGNQEEEMRAEWELLRRKRDGMPGGCWGGRRVVCE